MKKENIMKYYVCLIQFVVLFFYAVTNVSAKDYLNNLENKGKEASYKIEKHTCYDMLKCSYDIRLKSKQSKDELQKISLEILDESPAIRKMYIMFYLPCMKIGSGAWASSIWEGERLKIDIMDYMLLSNKACIE